MERIQGLTLHHGIKFGVIFIYDPQKDKLDSYSSDNDLIILSKNLLPSETVQFTRSNVVGIVATDATKTSHTAILSSTMDWPAISSIDINSDWHNKLAIIDGYTGVLLIEPSEEDITYYKQRMLEEAEQKQKLLQSYKNCTGVTKSGKTLQIFANISMPADVSKVIENGAEAIGNFKTEFMYLASEDYPTEQEQFEVYKELVTSMAGKKVVIRTFDIGTDKVVDYFNLEQEDNPALGYRAIRIGLDRPEIFKTQLRAIIRASHYGTVALMYPMIVSVEEVLAIKQMVADVMAELKSENIPFDENIEQGIMIETPASVIMSDELAKVCDFFSIGTNDLIQYTLAVDRQNPKLNSVYNPYHPAILRSIKQVVENAHKASIWVEISGELGADASLTKQFIEYGVDAIAVSPTKILPLRKLVCETE